MHDFEFSAAALQEPSTVLNLPLNRFTIGHELILHKRRNALVVYSDSFFDGLKPDEQGAVLADAVLICAKELPAAVKVWSASIKGIDLPEEVKKFRAYRAGGTSDLPTIPQPRQKGVPFHYFGGPELGRLINYVSQFHSLLIHSNYEGSPLNFPLGFARHLYTIHLECEGAVWIRNHQDDENEARIKAFEAENPESTLAIGDEAVKKLREKWNMDHPDTPAPE